MKRWKKIREKLAYDGWRKIIVKSFLMPNEKEADFDIIGNGSYVTIAAFTKEKKAILVRQYRPGPEMIMTSFSEGYIDNKESFEDAAKRELLEETGYLAEEVVLLKIIRKAYSTEEQVCVLATNCYKVGPQKLDEQEFIEVLIMSIEELMELIKDPQDHSFANTDAAYLALDKMGFLRF